MVEGLCRCRPTPRCEAWMLEEDMSEIQKGTLEVGTTGKGEVIINHPDLEPDENGVGHIVFSVEEARNLANLLMSKAADAVVERGD